MAQLVNYNRILETSVQRDQLIRDLVPSIQGSDKGYVVTTDWRSWIKVDQSHTDKRPWIIAAIMFLLFDFFFFWTNSKKSVLGIDMDATSVGTTLRITGVCSNSLAQHIESFVAYTQQNALDTRAGGPGHVPATQLVDGPGNFSVIQAPAAQPSQINQPVPSEEVQSIFTRAACASCECQDFQPSPDPQVCSCGHDAATAHTLLCPPPKPSPALDWAGRWIDSDRILICGGSVEGSKVTETWIYSITQNQWKSGPSLPSPCSGGRLVEPSPGRVVFLGATAENGMLAPTLEFSESSNSWTNLPSPSIPRTEAGACADGQGNIYLIGGVDDATQSESAAAEVFSFAAGGWRERARLITPRKEPAVIGLVNGSIMVVGGMSNGAHLPSAELLDPVTGSFSSLPDAPIPFSGGGGFETPAGTPNPGVIAIGGGTNASDENGVDTMLLFVPQTQRWVMIDQNLVRVRPARYGRRAIPGQEATLRTFLIK